MTLEVIGALWEHRGEPEEMEETVGKNVFQTQEDWHTYELTESETACTRPAQIHNRWGLRPK